MTENLINGAIYTGDFMCCGYTMEADVDKKPVHHMKPIGSVQVKKDPLTEGAFVRTPNGVGQIIQVCRDGVYTTACPSALRSWYNVVPITSEEVAVFKAEEERKTPLKDATETALQAELARRWAAAAKAVK